MPMGFKTKLKILSTRPLHDEKYASEVQRIIFHEILDGGPKNQPSK